MPHERLKPSWTFDTDRIEKLKEIAPEAFADGKVNWESLRAALGEHLEDEEGHAEHFGLYWPGKREARRFASIPSKGTLIPAPGEGIDEDKTGNIFIEGENLEVLKLLRKSYLGRIKMIYIDPPYNTGNDFVYDDDFTEPLESYLKMTGQVDEEDKPLTTNPRSDGRFHSKWLSMMYPRLRLARELLQDDGVIFVSIDDNEVNNLRTAMNEIFGEENFVSEMVWQSKKGGGSDSTGMVLDIEYIICYARTKGSGLSKIEIISEDLDLKDEKGPYRLGRELNKWGSGSRRQDRPTMFFPIKGPKGIDVYPIRNDGSEGRWRWGKKKMSEINERGDVEFEKRKSGTYIVYEKIRTKDPRYKPYRSLVNIKATTADGTKRLKELFKNKNYFDYAKPLELILYLFKVIDIDENDIVLDFFAGTGTTADAALKYTNQTGININVISIQFPESLKENDVAKKDGYLTISEISKERIRRVIKMLQHEMKNNKGLFDENIEPNMGFKVFKLTNSHYRQWENYHGDDPEKLESLFDEMKTPLIPSWKPGNLITEIMLMEGFPLDSRISNLKELSKNRVQSIESKSCGHRLLVCLDENVYSETIKALDLADRDIFICLDTAVTDTDKARLSDKGLIKTI